jgi:centromere protein C
MGLCEPEDLVREGMHPPPKTHTRKTNLYVCTDLAFAQSSIVTRDVAGSEFKYAKIMTLPFFGSGIVELPPEGFKRAKNSSKMQMCFFVHEGKVMVEVGPATDGETNTFAISRGGVWVVPRGKISSFPFSFACVLGIWFLNVFQLVRRGELGTRLWTKSCQMAVTHRSNTLSTLSCASNTSNAGLQLAYAQYARIVRC